VLGVNSGNDNLPPSLPPAKGNTPQPNPTPDPKKEARRTQPSGPTESKPIASKNVGQGQPELPKIRPQPLPPTPPPLPPKSDSFVQQPKPAEPARFPKRPYPLRLVVTLLSLCLFGLLVFGSFLIVSPDGRSIKLYTESTPDRLDLLKQPKPPVPAVPSAKSNS
jgi:hypothetical protein